jgi:DnaD/phage-associated family protein
MFAKTIIDSDAFLDMPMSARLLYYDLGMRADDDGFVNSPKKIQRVIGCSDDDIKLLIAKKFIIPFESGVVVVKHWKINNFIRSDRYNETKYKQEKSMLQLDENMAYRLTSGIPNGNQLGDERSTQVSLGKVNLITIADVKKFYEDNGFGMLVISVLNDINSFLDDGVEPELIIQAMKDSIDNGVHKWVYTKKILSDCLINKVITLEQFQIRQREKEANKTRQYEKPKADKYADW